MLKNQQSPKYPLFDKLDISLIKIIDSKDKNLKKYKQINYNGEQLIVIGPKMCIDNQTTGVNMNLYLLNESDVSFFTEIDVKIMKTLIKVFPNIENIYTQSIRRSMNNDNLYLRNYSPEKEVVYFDDDNVEISWDDITTMLLNKDSIKYVLPLLTPRLNNTPNSKHLEWDILQIKVFTSKPRQETIIPCVIVVDSSDDLDDDDNDTLNLDDS